MDRLLVDTNVLVDYLGNREPFSQQARLLMILGKVGEYSLWVSATQITDLVYILSNGGTKSRMPQVAESIEGLLKFVNVYAAGVQEIRQGLRACWDNPEDAMLHAVAQKIQAAAIITRNQADFEKSLIPVFDCQEFFEDLASKGVQYAEVDL
ncbi:MAG: PIN domain-containing protein [Eggerthellales bacterium]|nr:PIN domain-containing protein [Eggerthellales bacterium]